MDALGQVATNFTSKSTPMAFQEKKGKLPTKQLRISLQHSYFWKTPSKKNKKEDGLYHAYNLISIDENEVSVDYLAEMLEGQVAVLSAQYLNPEENLAVLDALRESSSCIAKINKAMFYTPTRPFLYSINRNTIPAAAVSTSALCQNLLNEGNFQILSQDIRNYHFNGNFQNADDLKAALEALPENYSELVTQDREHLLASFEAVFNHKAFTGRSGTFYGYEGLGSVTSHMVSKLALAAYEVVVNAIETNADEAIIAQLKQHYYAIVEGIGAHKSPVDYGAFPSDPYSHTPAGKRSTATGNDEQVKEDIISRFWGTRITN